VPSHKNFIRSCCPKKRSVLDDCRPNSWTHQRPSINLAPPEYQVCGMCASREAISLAERSPEKAGVGGSTPSLATKIIHRQ